MSKIDLSVIIPSLGEHQNLRILIPKIIKILKKKISYEILIVDGTSKDFETYNIKKKQQKHKISK